MTRLWLIGGGVFLGLLLIVSIVLAFTQKEELLPLGTAEAAVQDFLKAAKSDDIDLSYSYLSKELQAECKVEDFVGRSPYQIQQITDSRVTLNKTTVAGEVTFVDVDISQYNNGGIFGASEYTHSQRFSLKQEEGLWKFSSYPWPYNFCKSPVRVTPAPAPYRLEPTPAPTQAPLLAPTAEPTSKPAAP